MLTRLHTREVNWPARLGVGVVIVFLLLAVVLPIGLLVFASLVEQEPSPGQFEYTPTLDNYTALRDASNLSAAKNSAIIGILGTALAATWGTLLAWLAARTNIPFKPLVRFIGIVPLFVPPLVAALAYSVMGSPKQGLVNLALHQLNPNWTLNAFSMLGIIFVFGIYYAPYVYLFVYAALTLANPELEECAAVHGANGRRIARHITIPMVVPALVGGSILAFALITEDFPVPQVLGSSSGIYTLPSLIYLYMTQTPILPNHAAALGVLFMLVMGVLIFAQRRYVGARVYTTVSGKGFRPRTRDLGRWRWLGLALVAIYMLFAMILPLASLLVVGFRQSLYLQRISDLFSLNGWSLLHLQDVVTYGPFVVGLKNSLIAAAVAAVLGGVLYFVMAYTVYRTTAGGRSLIEYVAVLPVAMPATVFGIALLWTWLIVPIPLYGTLGILSLAFMARFLPQGFRGMSTSMLQVHREVEEAARVSGASQRRAVAAILLPLMRTSIFSSVLLIFILSMRELSASVFLSTGQTQVLSVVMLNVYEIGSTARVAIISLFYILILGTVTFLGRRLLSSDSPQSG